MGFLEFGLYFLGWTAIAAVAVGFVFVWAIILIAAFGG